MPDLLFGILEGLLKVLLDPLIGGPNIFELAELLIVEHLMAEKQEALHAHLLPQPLQLPLLFRNVHLIFVGVVELIVHLFAAEVGVAQDQLRLGLQLFLALVVIELLWRAEEGQPAFSRAWLVPQPECVTDRQLVG